MKVLEIAELAGMEIGNEILSWNLYIQEKEEEMIKNLFLHNFLANSPRLGQ